MKIVTCAFNEARLLPVMLGHLPPDSEVIVFDGALEDYPHDEPWSTDGTVDIAKRYGAEVVEVTQAWPSQIVKRNATLIEGETVFILDADELLLSPIVNLPEWADVGWVTFVSPVYAAPFLEPRVFRVGEGWHYGGRHHWIYDGDGNLVASHRKAGETHNHVILPMVVDNLADLRPEQVNADKRQFLNRMNAKELMYASEDDGAVRPPA